MEYKFILIMNDHLSTFYEIQSQFQGQTEAIIFISDFYFFYIIKISELCLWPVMSGQAAGTQCLNLCVYANN
jgi:hypothetical protein